jgi:hypothetical protein
MNTDKVDPIYKAESPQIVCAAMEMLNAIGDGV